MLITKNCRRGSRGGTPVQSDTEVELSRSAAGDKSSQSWRWGELPEPPVRTGEPVLESLDSPLEVSQFKDNFIAGDINKDLTDRQ